MIEDMSHRNHLKEKTHTPKMNHPPLSEAGDFLKLFSLVFLVVLGFSSAKGYWIAHRSDSD
jgi:hypothetical protein